MHSVSNIFMAFAILCALCGVASSVMIAGALQNRGVKINWIWLRVLIVTRYLGQYREITRKENGRPGWLYYSFVAGMNLALVFAVIGLVLRARGL